MATVAQEKNKPTTKQTYAVFEARKQSEKTTKISSVEFTNKTVTRVQIR